MKEKSTKSSAIKKVGKGKVRKFKKGKSSLQLVDEDEKAQPEPEPQAYGQAPVGGVAIREPNLETTRKLPVVEGKGKGIATDEQDDTSANIVRDTPSPPDAETGAEAGWFLTVWVITKDPDVGKEKDEDQDGSNPGQSYVALAGPNPEPMHEDFIATVYPKVHESLKHTTKEQVFLENPPSLFGTLSSMKNLDDDFTYGDQFLYDKPTKEEQGQANVETKVESIITITIHQASLIVPPSLTLQQICANFEKKNKVQDQTAQALSSRIFTLENHDLYSKIDKYINEKVKEAVQDALQAILRERFRELSGFEMKEILHDRMFKSGSYRSQPEHTSLYDALKASMNREKREERFH
ncbi:hypothetical protein Tco_1293641 [Tanacetum coccineum]